MMRENQTPLKDQARSAKLANRVPKKKIAKKIFNTEFSSVSEGSEVISSSISEISDANSNGDFTENLMLVPDPTLSASSETLFQSDLVPSPESSIDKDEPGHVSLTIEKMSDFDGTNFSCLEAELVAGFLRQARTQVLSANVEAKSKKIVDALVETVIEGFCTLPAERDRVAELLPAKCYIVMACFFLWVVAMAVWVCSGGQGNLRGFLPT